MRKILQKIWLAKEEYFVFWASILFYFLLYFNLNNKTLLLLFALFILVLIFKFKKIEEALFWGFVASLPFLVGKTYSYTLIPPTQLFRLQNPNGYVVDFVFTTGDIIAIFMFFFLIKALLFSREKRKQFFDWSLVWILFLVIFCFLSASRSKNPDLSLLFFLQFLAAPLVFLYAKNLIDWGNGRHRLLVFLLLAQVIFESAWVFSQFLNNGPLGRSIELRLEIIPFGWGADEEFFRYRPTGTFSHANYVAAFLLPRLILAFSFLYERAYLRYTPYLLGGLVLGIFALVITLSRSSWFSLFLAILILSYIFEKKLKLAFPKELTKRLIPLILLALPILAFFVLPRLVMSFNTFAATGGYTTRVELTREALELIRENFFLGVGFKMSVLEMFQNNPRGILYYFPTPVHNWYLHFASEAGVLALLSFLFGVNFLLRKVVVYLKRDLFLIGVFASVVAILINGFFQPFLGGMEFLFILLAILAYV